MDVFIKTAGLILLALLLGIVLTKEGKDFSILLTVFVCTIIALAALRYISPIIDFLTKLQVMGDLDPEILTTLLRAVGIGILSEIICQICADAGNASLGKTLQILSAAVVLWLSVPLFTGLIELVEKILVAI